MRVKISLFKKIDKILSNATIQNKEHQKVQIYLDYINTVHLKCYRII